MLNEPLILEISQRLRALLLPTAGASVERIAERLGLPEDSLRKLLEPRPGQYIDTNFLVDALAAVVHEYGVDSTWLLTGQYRAATHMKLEAEGPLPFPAVRTIITEQLASA